jgi:hypothetical protein
LSSEAAPGPFKTRPGTLLGLANADVILHPEACKTGKEFPMNWLAHLFVQKAKPSPRKTRDSARRLARPSLEALEERQLLSATSAITYTPAGSTIPAHVLYAIDSRTRRLTEYVNSRPVQSPGGTLGGPGLTAVSASIDQKTGNPEVFALAADHSLWLYSLAGGWRSLGGSDTEVSAERDGRAFVVDSSNLVRVYNADGTVQALGAPAYSYDAGDWGSGTYVYAFGISAGRAALTSSTLQDVVYAIGPDGGIYANAGAGWQVVDNNHSFSQLSATQDGSVYALDNAGNLYQDSWTQLSTGGGTWVSHTLPGPGSGNYYTQISAGTDLKGNDLVYAVDKYSYLWEAHSRGAWAIHWHGSSGFVIRVTDISGTDGGRFYFVDYNFYGQNVSNTWLGYHSWGSIYTFRLPGSNL